MLSTRHFWQSFMFNYVGKEKVLADSINRLVQLGYPSVEVAWGAPKTAASAVAEAEPVVGEPPALESETETEDLNDRETMLVDSEPMLVDSDGYPINMSDDHLGVD